MVKKGLFLLFLLFISLPAYAWQLQTRVATVGGSLAIDSGTPQTSVNGTKYTTYPNTVGNTHTVTVTPATGYIVDKVLYNSIVTPAPYPNVTYDPAKTTQSVLVYFKKQTFALTTVAETGGTVSPVGTSQVAVGTAKSVVFTPLTGKNVVAIDGVPAGASVVPAVPAALNTKVTVSFTMPAAPVTLTGKFVSLTVSTDGPKTILLPNAVTLNATSDPAGATFAWAQTGGPGYAPDAVPPQLGITGSGPSLTFAPAVVGNYKFKVTATSDGNTAIANTTVIVTDDLVEAATAQCNVCHLSRNLGQDEFSDWSTSVHVTNPYHKVMCYDCHIGALSGGHPGQVPTNATCTSCHSGPYTPHGPSLTDCLSCHDPHSLAFGGDTSDCAACHTVDNTIHSALACNGCHTGSHGEIPDETSATNICVTCHTAATPEIAGEWTAGAHGQATGHLTGTCQRCHASEGSLVGAEVGWTGSYSVLMANQAAIWTPNAPATSTDGVDCAACHDPHSSNGLRPVNTYTGGAVVPWDPNQNGASNDQLDVCTSCHTLYDNTGALVGNYHDGGSINVTRTISDSHHDNPATGVGLAANVVEGYVVRQNSSSPCFDCHNLHTADLTIQEAWAASAHAGKIAMKKDEAACAESITWFNTTYPTNPAVPVDSCADTATVGTSTRTVLEHFQRNTAGIAFYKTTGAVDDADGNGWTHYNWDQTSSRGSCQRCHTATGAMNFLNNPAGYAADGSGNSFSHLAGWSAATGSPQQELLYCWGCHSNAGNGDLRNPGAITEVYAAATAGAPPATIAYPNIGPSNVCMGCHLGREIGANVANDTDPDGVRSFINSHYLAAGGMVFNAAGYEYAGRTYDSFGYHKNVGQANAFGTGTSGPCVTCHMSGAESHSFEVSAASTACAQCHGGLTDGILMASKEEFHAALEELNHALLTKGIEFKPTHPYFYIAGTNTAFTNWAGVYGLDKWKDVMGAAFNYNLIEHDPGAYAHNRAYALHLIQDSIDFLADGAVDGQGTSAVVAAVIESDAFGQATTHTPAALADPSESSCGICHPAAPHYAPVGEAQYLGENLTCTDCHAGGDTTANGTILAGFAESGHADVGGTWSHEEAGSSCSRCHTASGFVANLTTGGYYTYPNPEDQNRLQVLACSACHTDLSAGERRPAPAFTATWTQNSVTAVASFPDVGDSNLCVRCHSARRAGPNITDTATTTAHYLPIAASVFSGTANFVEITASVPAGPAVGTMFSGVGYEFAGQDYSNLGYHKQIGVNNVFNTGIGGPCAGCHMSGDADHSWEPVKDENGNVTAVLSSICVNCHTDMNASHLNASKARFALALDELDLALQAKQFFFNPADGRFYTTAAHTTPVNAAWYTARAAEYSLDVSDLEGAAFNLWLYAYAGGDPCGYVHNRDYALKLIATSVDYLNDGLVDGDSNEAYEQIDQGIDFGHSDPIVDAANETTCGTCHASAPHYGGTVLAQAQYVSAAPTYPVSCANCHSSNDVTANPAILVQFAESAHGDAQGEGWWHYDWRSSGRAACARCHAGTAYVAKLGNEVDTTWIYTTADTNLPGEVLNCASCHTDLNSGAVREPGRYTETYSDGATHLFPDVAKSNLCVRCHSGRESGDTIKADTDADGVRGFINSHYLSAGGTVFSTTGYEYAGRTYSYLGHIHDIAGISIDPDTEYPSPVPSDPGPCVICHMGDGDPDRTADHTWEVVAKDEAGIITAINSNACIECHNNGMSITAAGLQNSKDGFHAALEALYDALANRGMYFQPRNPYFFVSTAPDAVAFTDWASVAVALGQPAVPGYQDAMGAAFNYNLLEHDPGAYAHNRMYARRLIFDSIDYLDNGVLGGTIDLTGHEDAAAYLNPTYTNITAVSRPH